MALLGVAPAVWNGGALEAQEPKARSGAQVDPYVGDQMCVRCHGDPSAKDAVHQAAPSPDPRVDGCQSCHGPGRAHVQDPDSAALRPAVDRLSAADLIRMCGECHGEMAPFGALHAEMACGECHVFHAADPAPQGKCMSCHSGSQPYDELHAYDLAQMATGEIACESCHRQAHGG